MPLKILQNEDIEKLSEGVLKILEKIGLNCENKNVLKYLEETGAEVDYENFTAKFPRKIVEKFIDIIKKENKWEDEIKGENQHTIYSGYFPTKADNKFLAPTPGYLFHQAAPFFYDDETGIKRKGNKEDFIKLIKIGSVLHPQHGCGHSLLLMDVPPLLEPLEAASLLIEYANKPRGVYIQDVLQIPYLIEIEEIAGIKDPYWHWFANVSFATPLKLEKNIAERFIEMVKSGNYPAKVYTMGISGVNIPVTTAGYIVLTSAEFLALWMIGKSINPDIPLTGLVLSGVLNMQTGEVRYGGFDVLIRALGVHEFIKRWIGVSVCPGIGEYTPSKLPGFYTTLEKAYHAMTICAFTGSHPDLGIGHLEAGLSISPVQLLFDREFSKGLQLLEEIPVNSDTIGLDTITEVGFGKTMNYLETIHTLSNFRSSLWMPEFFNPEGWTPEIEKNSLEKTKARIRELINEYKKPEVDPEVILKIRKVIERASKNLIK